MNHRWFFQHYLKINEIINLKNQFQLKERRNIKTIHEQKLLRILGGLSPSQYLALYAKSFLVISNNLSVLIKVYLSFLFSHTE